MLSVVSCVIRIVFVGRPYMVYIDLRLFLYVTTSLSLFITTTPIISLLRHENFGPLDNLSRCVTLLIQ